MPITLKIETSFSSRAVEIKQRTPGQMKPIPEEYLDGYVSPSGGYMNYARYKVSGMNPKTNRKKTVFCDGDSEEEAIEFAAQSGLDKPYDISVVPFDPPSDSQIQYAKDLGITIPEGACLMDVSALICRVKDDDETAPDEWTTKNAIKQGVRFSRYIGKRALLNLSTAALLQKKKGKK